MGFFSCTQSSSPVVPSSYFSISFNGKTYSDVSNDLHPISAGVSMITDQVRNSQVYVCNVTDNSNNISFSLAGYTTNTGSNTGSYFVEQRNASGIMTCPFTLVDKGDNYKVYTTDSFSTITINQADAHIISGTFHLNLYNGGTTYPATGSFTYNIFFGSH